MREGARRSAAAARSNTLGRVPLSLQGFWERRKYWIIAIGLFLLLDLVVGLAISAAGGHL